MESSPESSRGRDHGALSKERRDKLTPDDIIKLIKNGNERFRKGKESPHDYLAQQKASAKGQYPAAVILSCIDSRAPAETIMDLGIGDTFNAGVAGNVANDDILGSMEFACKSRRRDVQPRNGGDRLLRLMERPATE